MFRPVIGSARTSWYRFAPESGCFGASRNEGMLMSDADLTAAAGVTAMSCAPTQKAPVLGTAPTQEPSVPEAASPTEKPPVPEVAPSASSGTVPSVVIEATAAGDG